MSDAEDDDFDEFESLDDSAIREELLNRLQTVWAVKALKTSLAVCDNEKAPAAARVQASSNILRAGGFFAKRESDGKEKELHEMNPDEFNAVLREARAELKQRTDTPKDDIFG